MCNCNCSFNCTLAAIVSSVIVGVVAAFLQVLGIITVGVTFLWVALGVGLVFLAVLVAVSAANRDVDRPVCLCKILNTLLIAVLGTILVSLVLLAVGIVATSVLSAILVGALLFFLWLTLTASACFVRCLADCA